MDLKTAFCAAALAYYKTPDIDDGLAMRELEHIHTVITNSQIDDNKEKLLIDYLDTIATGVENKELAPRLFGTNILKFQD